MGLFLFVIIMFLTFFCISEFVLLIKDNGIFARLCSAALKMANKKGMLYTFFFCFKFCVRTIYNITKKIFVRFVNRLNHNTPQFINLAIVVEGGLGDYLLTANWLEYVRNEFIDNTVKIFIVYHIKSALAIFPENDTAISLLKSSSYNPDSFDAEIRITTFPALGFAKEELIKKISPKLWRYIEQLKLFTNEIRFEFDNHPKTVALMSARTLIQGKKRIQEPDFYNILGITEDYRYNLPIKENEDSYLASIGLKDRKYILVHRGWDASANGDSFHVKAWSLKSCGDIIYRLKEEFPEYSIVLFGLSRNQAPNPKGCDLDLLEKTSLEQVKVLLKHAACLIDNEGGMVHLRHALRGGSSVVLFGSTSPELFGYSENINIRKNVCSHWCEWITADWTQKCIKTEEKDSPCMNSITSIDIIESVRKIISGDINEY